MLILGGSKLETKLPTINNLLAKYDYILIGGAIANTLLKEKGIDVKKSLVDKCPKEVKSIITETKIILPIDFIWQADKILDIGSKTIIKFTDILSNSRTVVWNGPLGLYETKPFDQGTVEIGKYLLDLKVFKVIGGGDTIDSLKNLPIFGKIDHVSTAGGAMLEFLAGNKMPGIEALS